MGNELIARFMGGVRQKATSYSIHDFPNELPPYILKSLKYHTSWDWLMPVVERLQEPEVKDGRMIREPADIYINYKNCQIEFISEEQDIEYDLHPQGIKAETKIGAVYKAVVEFIKWYNEQNHDKT